ncbi:MAG: sigma-70 family RNA polymerase sigma factor [Gemmataceae bacterium]
MNRSILQSMIRHVEALAVGTGTDSPSDEALLARFIKDQDESAFTAILSRHGRLVWAVCRGILSHDADAEDAFQATFLALFRGAKRIREVRSLAPWLHGTATKIAKKAFLTAGRRTGREKRAAKPEATALPAPDSSSTWDATFQIVHDEIAKLPATLRGAFVLCVLEGERHQEAAAKLGVPIGTLSARVSRARQKLLDRLTSRGLAPGLAAAALALGINTGPAAVPDVVLTATRLAAMNGFTTISTSITTLAVSATEGTTMKVKLLAAAVMIGTAMTLSTGGSLLNRAEGQVLKPSPTPAANQTPAARTAPPTAMAPAASPLALPSPAAMPDAPRPNPIQSQPAVPSVNLPAPTASAPAVMAPSMDLPNGPPPQPHASSPSPRTVNKPITYFTTERPNTLAAFQDLLRTKAAEGWVYLGSETFQDRPGQAHYVVVIFRQEVAAPVNHLRSDVNPNPNRFYESVVDANGMYGYVQRPASTPQPGAVINTMLPSPEATTVPPTPYVNPTTPNIPPMIPAESGPPIPRTPPQNPPAAIIPSDNPIYSSPPIPSTTRPAGLPTSPELIPAPETKTMPNGYTANTVTIASRDSANLPTNTTKPASKPSLVELYKYALRESKTIKLDTKVNCQTMALVINEHLTQTEPELMDRLSIKTDSRDLVINGPPKEIARIESMIRKLEKEVLDSQKANQK